jgi:hypothetical protein
MPLYSGMLQLRTNSIMPDRKMTEWNDQKRNIVVVVRLVLDEPLRFLLFMWSLPRISVTNKTVLLLLLLLSGRSSSSSSHDSPDLNRAGFCEDPCVHGTENIMSIKEHGTSHIPVQSNLRWGQTWSIADRLCNFNRKFVSWLVAGIPGVVFFLRLLLPPRLPLASPCVCFAINLLLGLVLYYRK